MTRSLFSLFVLAAAFLSACIPSLNPISAENETTIPAIEGKWESSGTEFNVELKGNFYTITSKNKNAGANESPIEYYKMTLTQIGNETYAGITADLKAPEVKKMIGGDTTSFLLPIWRLYRITVSENEIRLYWIDDNNGPAPKKLKSIQIGESESMFTATSAELKTWIAENQALFAESKGENKNYFLYKKIK